MMSKHTFFIKKIAFMASIDLLSYLLFPYLVVNRKEAVRDRDDKGRNSGNTMTKIEIELVTNLSLLR